MNGSILIVPMTRKPEIERRVRNRVKLGQCIGQTKTGEECTNPAHRRGLCTKCAYRWRAAKAGMTAQQQAEYDAKLIVEGRLLTPSETNQIQNESCYIKLARQIGRAS